MKFKEGKIQIMDSDIHLLEFENFDVNIYLDQLTSIEKEKLFTISNEKRKQEFVATRILRHSIFGYNHIHYNSVGAPFIENAGFISISHSNNIVGIALNEKYQIGFDIEFIRPNIKKISHKFLSETEIDQFDCEDEKTLTEIWSSKESLYKVSNQKELDFKTNLILSKKQNQIIGEIKTNQKHLSTKISIFEYNDKIITINSSPCE